MNRKKIEIIITALLVMVFVLAWARTIGLMVKKKRASSGAPQADISARPAHRPRKPAKAQARKEKTQDTKNSAWGRDPFRRNVMLTDRYVSPKKADTDFRLTGIVFDKKNPEDAYALLNQDIIKTGDSISGFLVEDIKEGRVILRKGEETVILKVWESEI